MNIDIRKSIINNFKDSTTSDIRNSINEAINSNDEITLPGIGVFFEILWKNTDVEEKEKILNTIYNYIKKES